MPHFNLEGVRLLLQFLTILIQGIIIIPGIPYLVLILRIYQFIVIELTLEWR